MKLYLQEISENQYNAGSKARNDVDCILKSLGYQPCIFYGKKNRINRVLHTLILIYRLWISRNKIETIFFQYPYNLFSIKSSSLLLFKLICSFYHGRIECLIHDINGIRNGKQFDEDLKYISQHASKVIVHTPRMKNILINETGIDETRISVLYLFDYLASSKVHPTDISGKEVIFAGNLAKSLFLQKLYKLPDSIHFQLYGIQTKAIKDSSNCTYKGKFHPDDISGLEGNWGLVWDGDQLETCSGNMGKYLKTNSSHKLSLYLAACKPVIIWDQSSLKDFIQNNHLGIAVSSLYDIETAINKITDDEKELIKKSVEKVSHKLRHGMFLKECINT